MQKNCDTDTIVSFAVKMVQSLFTKVGPAGLRIAVVSFRGDAVVEFDFNDSIQGGRSSLFAAPCFSYTQACLEPRTQPAAGGCFGFGVCVMRFCGFVHQLFL